MANDVTCENTQRPLLCVIADAARRVYKEMGYGFTENVYQNALEYELSFEKDLEIIPQFTIRVQYKGHYVGTGIPDMLVRRVRETRDESDRPVIVELKTGRTNNCASAGLMQAMAYRRALAASDPDVQYDLIAVSFLPTVTLIETRRDEGDVLDVPFEGLMA